MRKPNTSLPAPEARLHTAYAVHRSTFHVAVAADLRHRRTHRTVAPKFLQHWTKERPESLQAKHTDLSLLGQEPISLKTHLGDSPSRGRIKAQLRSFVKVISLTVTINIHLDKSVRENEVSRLGGPQSFGVGGLKVSENSPYFYQS